MICCDDLHAQCASSNSCYVTEKRDMSLIPPFIRMNSNPYHSGRSGISESALERSRHILKRLTSHVGQWQTDFVSSSNTCIFNLKCIFSFAPYPFTPPSSEQTTTKDQPTSSSLSTSITRNFGYYFQLIFADYQNYNYFRYE